MQIDHEIRMCPAIAEASGLEPYPQPMVQFDPSPTGAVSVRIYDVSVNPPVELTSSALSGAELTTPSLTGMSDVRHLDMGHANVTAVVDAYTREGLECVVQFSDSAGNPQVHRVKVTCNDADHVGQLYPDGAVYAVALSGITGTAFPNGSIFRPVENLGDACTIFGNRGAKILDCAGSWNGHPTAGSGGCLAADIGTTLSSAKALIRTRSSASWYPHNSGDVIDLVDCTVQSVNVPYGFSLGNFTNGTYFAGTPTLVNCRVQQSYFTGNGSTRQGGCNATACKFDGDIFLSAFQSPGCWSFDGVGCINGTAITVDFTSMGGNTATWVDCAGEWTIYDMPDSKAIEMTGIRGMPNITIDRSVGTVSNNLSATLTGAYAGLTNNAGTLASLTEVRQPGVGDLLTQAAAQTAAEAAITAQEPIAANVTQVAAGAVAGVADFRATGFAVAGDAMTLQAGAVTATEAPALANLDAAVSGCATPGDAMTLTTATQNAVRDARLWVRADGGPVATPGPNASPIVYDSAGFAAVIRRRFFDSAAAAAAATDGEADGADGEVHSEYLRSVQSGSNAYPSHFREVGS